MELRVDHTASRESLDHSQLLYPEQHQRCPDVIEELNSDKQNPERDFVSLTPGCKSNAVMPNKHSCLLIRRRDHSRNIPQEILGCRIEMPQPTAAATMAARMIRFHSRRDDSTKSSRHRK
jgi:hypothetical protein